MFLLFNFDNFQMWKLNTLSDWINFLVVGFGAFALILVYYRIMVGNRSEAAAVGRTNRRLKRRGGKEAKTYMNVGLRIDDKEIVIDNLLIDKYGILIGHTFGRGLTAYGEPKDEFWRIKDNEGSELVPNPLYEVDGMIHPIQTVLAKKDIYGVSIEGIAVFADNFSEPQLFVGKANAFSIKYLKKYFVQRRLGKETVKDPAKVAEVLEPYFFEVPLKENYKQRKTRVKQEKKEAKAAQKAAKQAAKSAGK